MKTRVSLGPPVFSIDSVCPLRSEIGRLSSQHLAGGTTEKAVLAYLRKKHPGYEITLMSLEWK